jgi:hypothetical protein
MLAIRILMHYLAYSSVVQLTSQHSATSLQRILTFVQRRLCLGHAVSPIVGRSAWRGRFIDVQGSPNSVGHRRLRVRPSPLVFRTFVTLAVSSGVGYRG